MTFDNIYYRLLVPLLSDFTTIPRIMKPAFPGLKPPVKITFPSFAACMVVPAFTPVVE